MNRAELWRHEAAEAAKRHAVELPLPSGVKILARRPDPAQLAMWGRLPMSLVGIARGEDGGRAEVSGEEALDLIRLMRELLIYCCVDPRVSLDPKGPDEIHPREIPDEDFKYIIRWATRVEEARSLHGFCGERADAGPGGHREGVRAAAVEPGGDRGSGACDQL